MSTDPFCFPWKLGGFRENYCCCVGNKLDPLAETSVCQELNILHMKVPMGFCTKDLGRMVTMVIACRNFAWIAARNPRHSCLKIKAFTPKIWWVCCCCSCYEKWGHRDLQQHLHNSEAHQLMPASMCLHAWGWFQMSAGAEWVMIKKTRSAIKPWQ